MTETRLTPKDRIILVGDKQFMQYISAISYQFVQENAPDLVIKARGKFIGRAIDLDIPVREA